MVRASCLVVIVAFALTAAGCGGSHSPPAESKGSPPPAGAGDRWGTVWLCRPGERDDPCVSDLTTTVIGPHGRKSVDRLAAAADPPIDCFYVYPTISGEQTVNADLAIDFRLREVAVAQAARFSQVCRVYAPVYRQITLAALEHPRRVTLAHALIAVRSVAAGFRDYLAHYNHGRGIVLIGHSQGAAILVRLIRQRFDGVPALRRRLVSALLMGGNVVVAKGGTDGGDFLHVPACVSIRETGCVVAYSSFATTPAANSQFGRTTSDAGVGLLARKPSANVHVLCVNPAAPAGGWGLLEPALPSLLLAFLPGKGAPSVSTPWVTFPGRYRARCESSGNASWLQVSAPRGGVGPALTRLQDPVLGLHVLDVNLALDNLVRLVQAETAAYARRPSH